MSWKKLSDESPNIEIHGDDVLIYREQVGTNQKNKIIVHGVYLIKHCDPNETWWMPMPSLPKEAQK